MADNEDRLRAVREGDQNAVIGDSDHEQHRAGPGEGVRAPLVSEGADHAEFSVFDGKGNESVVVVGANAKGQKSQGTGASAEEAAADARRGDNKLGEGFGFPGKH